MRFSQRTNTVILWLIAIALLVSMVIAFTPGTLFGGAQPQQAEAALLVNGQPIRTLDVARLGATPPFNAVQEGPAAEDLEQVLLDELIDQELLRQAASRINVSNAEVRARVNAFREEQGVAGSANDRAYLDLIGGAGYTDESFRALMREQLQRERYLESVAGELEVTDEEVRAHFEANRDRYRSEPRIRARQIVVTDEALANDLYARALAGEDFAALAREYSTERAEQGGALGAAEGESEPQPVTRVALPSAVADAAFALQGPGLTEPIEAAGAFHIVAVEAYEPPQLLPFEEVQERVREDVLAAKETGAQEAALRTLRAEATIETPAGSPYVYENPVVARVGDHEIRAAELNRNTYLSPQLQGLISPGFADVIAESIKPGVLDQLIDRELAFQGADELGVPLVGSRAQVAQSVLGYVSREAEASDDEVRRYYEENRAFFTQPAEAVATRFTFPDEAAAAAFREAVLAGGLVAGEALRDEAEAAGGSAERLGTLTPGSQPEAIEAALFDFENGMTPIVGDGGLEISGVLSLEVPVDPDTMTGGAMTGGETVGDETAEAVMTGGAMTGGAVTGGAPTTGREFVVLVAARTPERVQPLEEVRALVEQAVLNQNRRELQEAWLEERRQETPVENLLVAEAPENLQTGGAQTGGAE
jgi:parvulin-like peptidyl-prolyl isomerase